MVPAFLTGSHAYGRPHARSDVDLVVFVSAEDVEVLRAHCDPEPVKPEPRGDDYETPDDPTSPATWGCVPLRFGGLSLLCCTDPVAYAVWFNGTRRLEAESRDTGPVDRGLAVKFLTALRRHAGLYAKRPTIENAMDAGPHTGATDAY